MMPFKRIDNFIDQFAVDWYNFKADSYHKVVNYLYGLLQNSVQSEIRAHLAKTNQALNELCAEVRQDGRQLDRLAEKTKDILKKMGQED